MGYNFKIDKYYVVKKEGNYPWPCLLQLDRTIELFTDDVLTGGNGIFTLHTGICCTNIRLTKDQVKFIKKPINLRMSNMSEMYGPTPTLKQIKEKK